MGKDYAERHGGKKPPPLTDGEIRYALYKQSATINALVALLQEKGILAKEDLATLEQNREKLFQLLQAAEGQESGPKIRPA